MRENDNFNIKYLYYFMLSLGICFSIKNFFNIEFFSGDDAIEFVLYDSNSIFGYLFNTSSNHFRPVSNLFMLFEWLLAGRSAQLVTFYNAIILSLFTTYVCILLEKFSGFKLVGLLIIPLICSSRFSWYHSMSVLGNMELVCCWVSLVIAESFFKYIENPSRKYLLKIIICYLLAIFSHERYIVLIVPILVFSLFSVKGKNYKLSVAILSLCSLALFYITKVYFLNLKFFTDTAQQEINLSFDIICENFNRIIMNLLQFPIGELHFQGIVFENIEYNYQQLIYFIATLTILFFLLYLLDLILLLVKKSYLDIFDIRLYLFLIGISLLIPPSVSFRLETRWLYLSYICFLIIAIITIKPYFKIKFTSLKIILSSLFIFFTIGTCQLNQYMINNAEPYFFLVQNRNRIKFYLSELVKYKDLLENKGLYIITSDNDSDELFCYLYQLNYKYDLEVVDHLSVDLNREYICKNTKYLFLFKRNNEFYVIDKEVTNISYSDYWIGKEYSNWFYTENGIIQIVTYYPPYFTSNGIRIYINNEEVLYTNDIYELKKFTFESTKYKGKLNLVRIVMDEVYKPYENGSDDLRDLGIILGGIYADSYISDLYK